MTTTPLLTSARLRPPSRAGGGGRRERRAHTTTHAGLVCTSVSAPGSLSHAARHGHPCAPPPPPPSLKHTRAPPTHPVCCAHDQHTRASCALHAIPELHELRLGLRASMRACVCACMCVCTSVCVCEWRWATRVSAAMLRTHTQGAAKRRVWHAVVAAALLPTSRPACASPRTNEPREPQRAPAAWPRARCAPRAW
jgi:hypothetical protein